MKFPHQDRTEVAKSPVKGHAIQIRTKFLRLREPVSLGDRIEGWRVCWLGGSDKGRIFFVVMVERKCGSSRSGDASQKLPLDGMRMKSRTEASPSVHKGLKPSRGV